MDPVSVLGGAVYEGTVTVRELPPRAMISLRGDLVSHTLQKAAADIAGGAFPGQGEATWDRERGILWMSPDELLLMAPRSALEDAMARVETALSGSHFLAADVSDARSIFRLEGDGAAVREVLAKLSPADVHPESFPPGVVRRTRLAQVPAAFWMRDADSAEVIAFRSVAAYVFGLLKNAAAAGRVDHF